MGWRNWKNGLCSLKRRDAKSGSESDLRLSLKDAYTEVAIGLRTSSEEKEAMLRQALALGEELKKFKPHPDDPMPWLEGTHRVVRETTEMVRGLADKAAKRRLEREAQERRG